MQSLVCCHKDINLHSYNQQNNELDIRQRYAITKLLLYFRIVPNSQISWDKINTFIVDSFLTCGKTQH